MANNIVSRITSAGTYYVGGQFDEVTPTQVPATSPFSTPTIITGSSNGQVMQGIAVNSSGLFVAVGNNGSSGYPLYATSTDGITWSTPALMNGSTVYANMTAITVNSFGLFVAVGTNNTGAALYATSTNGTTWTTPASMNGITSASFMTSITVNSSGLFVAVGYDSSYPLYATSTNGTTWTTPTQASTSLSCKFFAVTVNLSGRFVAVGSGNSTGYAIFSTSTDGSTWSTPALMNGALLIAQMQAIAVNSAGLFVAMGQYFNGTNYVTYYATSANGTTWTTPALIDPTAAVQMKSIAVNSSGFFVAVGYEYFNLYAYYTTSSDGSTWSTPTFMGTSPANGVRMYSVAVNSSGLFVAAGDFSGGTEPRSSVATYPNPSAIIPQRQLSTGILQVSNQFDEVTYVNKNKNLIYPSSNLISSSHYTAQANVIPNLIIAPDGSTTGVLLKEDNTNNSHIFQPNFYLDQSYANTNSQVTSSCYFKPYDIGNRQINFQIHDNPATSYAQIGLANNMSSYYSTATASGTFSNPQGKIESVGNGWYRASLSVKLSPNNTNIVSPILLINNGAQGYTGDGKSGVYIWGPQFEVNNTVTSYAPNPSKNLFVGTESLTNFNPNPYPWNTSTAIVVSTKDLDPNGNYTATNLSYGNAFTQVQTPSSTGIPVTANTIYTISVSVKSTQQQFSIVTGNNIAYPTGSSQWIYYDLVNNIAQYPGGTPLPIASTITTENNGYKRCTLSVQTDETQNQMYVGFWMGGYGGAATGNTMTLFGPQLELGNTATTYQANTINLISSKTLNGGTLAVTNEFDEVTWNPPIVTSGLVLNLDSFNPNSYNGTGNTWFDISGNNLQAQMSGGSGANTFPQFVTNTNSFYSNSPLSTSSFYINSPNTQLDSTSITIEVWSQQVNYNAGNEYGNVLSYRENYGSTGYRLGVTGAGTPTFWTGQTGGNIYVYSNTNTTSNTWYQTVITYDLPSLTCKMYLNGVLVGTQTSAVYNPPTGQQLSIQAVSDGITSMNGYYSVFRQYNRVLSQAEIIQNYKALQYRYGL